MIYDEWKLNKDFDELSCELNDFGKNRFSMHADYGVFLAPAKQKAEQINMDRPQAQ